MHILASPVRKVFRDHLVLLLIFTHKKTGSEELKWLDLDQWFSLRLHIRITWKALLKMLLKTWFLTQTIRSEAMELESTRRW